MEICCILYHDSYFYNTINLKLVFNQKLIKGINRTKIYKLLKKEGINKADVKTIRYSFRNKNEFKLLHYHDSIDVNSINKLVLLIKVGKYIFKKYLQLYINSKINNIDSKIVSAYSELRYRLSEFIYDSLNCSNEELNSSEILKNTYSLDKDNNKMNCLNNLKFKSKSKSKDSENYSNSSINNYNSDSINEGNSSISDFTLNIDRKELNDYTETNINLANKNSSYINYNNKYYKNFIKDKKASNKETNSTGKNSNFSNSNKETKNKNVDIAYFFSNPIEKVHLNNTYDYLKEVKLILNNCDNKNLNIEIQPATLENLENILLKNPKIIHLSVSGVFWSTENNNNIEDSFDITNNTIRDSENINHNLKRSLTNKFQKRNIEADNNLDLIRYTSNIYKSNYLNNCHNNLNSKNNNPFNINKNFIDSNNKSLNNLFKSDNLAVKLSTEFYLMFETNLGSLDRISYIDLIKLFTINHSNLELIIVNTPFVQEFEKLISSVITLSNKVNILYVYSDFSLPKDDASLKFIDKFYDLIINYNKSIKYAYSNSALLVENYFTRDKLNICCCYHIHHKDCKWVENFYIKFENENKVNSNLIRKSLIEYNSINNSDNLYNLVKNYYNTIDPHLTHIRTCNCTSKSNTNSYNTNSNEHLVHCESSVLFKLRFKKNKYSYLDYKDKIRLCCCGENIKADYNSNVNILSNSSNFISNHDFSRFILNLSSDYKGNAIFNSKVVDCNNLNESNDSENIKYCNINSNYIGNIELENFNIKINSISRFIEIKLAIDYIINGARLININSEFLNNNQLGVATFIGAYMYERNLIKDIKLFDYSTFTDIELAIMNLLNDFDLLNNLNINNISNLIINNNDNFKDIKILRNIDSETLLIFYSSKFDNDADVNYNVLNTLIYNSLKYTVNIKIIVCNNKIDCNIDNNKNNNLIRSKQNYLNNSNLHEKIKDSSIYSLKSRYYTDNIDNKITKNSNIYLNKQKTIVLSKLSNYVSALIIRYASYESLPLIIKNNIKRLKDDELVLITDGIFSNIKKITNMINCENEYLDENEYLEEVITKFKLEKYSLNNSTSTFSLIDDSLKDYDIEDKILIKKIIIILKINHLGLYINDFFTVFDDDIIIQKKIGSVLEKLSHNKLILYKKKLSYYINKQYKTKIYTNNNSFEDCYALNPDLLNLELIEKNNKSNKFEESCLFLNNIAKNYYKFIMLLFEKEKTIVNIKDIFNFCYERTFTLLACKLRHFIVSFNQDVNADEFSPIQNYGLWLSLSNNQSDYQIYSRKVVEKDLKLFNLIYEHILTDIFDINLIKDIFNSLEACNNSAFKESIEQLSICYPAIYYYINKNNDYSIKLLYKTLKILDIIDSDIAKARLYIFCVFLTPREESYINHVEELITESEELLEKSNYEEGKAELYFCKLCYQLGFKETDININVIYNDLNDLLKTYDKIINLSKIQTNKLIAKRSKARVIVILSEVFNKYRFINLNSYLIVEKNNKVNEYNKNIIEEHNYFKELNNNTEYIYNFLKEASSIFKSIKLDYMYLICLIEKIKLCISEINYTNIIKSNCLENLNPSVDINYLELCNKLIDEAKIKVRRKVHLSPIIENLNENYFKLLNNYAKESIIILKANQLIYHNDYNVPGVNNNDHSISFIENKINNKKTIINNNSKLIYNTNKILSINDICSNKIVKEFAYINNCLFNDISISKKLKQFFKYLNNYILTSSNNLKDDIKNTNKTEVIFKQNNLSYSNLVEAFEKGGDVLCLENNVFNSEKSVNLEDNTYSNYSIDLINFERIIIEKVENYQKNIDSNNVKIGLKNGRLFNIIILMYPQISLDLCYILQINKACNYIIYFYFRDSILKFLYSNLNINYNVLYEMFVSIFLYCYYYNKLNNKDFSNNDLLTISFNYSKRMFNMLFYNKFKIKLLNSEGPLIYNNDIIISRSNLNKNNKEKQINKYHTFIIEYLLYNDKIKDSLINLIDFKDISSKYMKDLLYNPFENIKKIGDIYSNSKKNVLNNFNIFVNRKTELYACIKTLLSGYNLNIYGIKGIGKTSLSVQLCIMLKQREYFKDGMYYFNLSKYSGNVLHNFKEDVLSKISDICKINSKNASENNFFNRILVVVDNIQRLIKNSIDGFISNSSINTSFINNTNKASNISNINNTNNQIDLISFFYFLFNLSPEGNIYYISFIFLSNNKIIDDNFLLSSYYNLQSFNIEDSAVLLSSSCYSVLKESYKLNNIYRNNRYTSNSEIMLQLLMSEKKLKLCLGIPSCIIALSRLIKRFKTFEKIDENKLKKLIVFKNNNNFLSNKSIDKKESSFYFNKSINNHSNFNYSCKYIKENNLLNNTLINRINTNKSYNTNYNNFDNYVDYNIFFLNNKLFSTEELPNKQYATNVLNNINNKLNTNEIINNSTEYKKSKGMETNSNNLLKDKSNKYLKVDKSTYEFKANNNLELECIKDISPIELKKYSVNSKHNTIKQTYNIIDKSINNRSSNQLNNYIKNTDINNTSIKIKKNKTSKYNFKLNTKNFLNNYDSIIYNENSNKINTNIYQSCNITYIQQNSPINIKDIDVCNSMSIKKSSKSLNSLIENQYTDNIDKKKHLLNTNNLLKVDFYDINNKVINDKNNYDNALFVTRFSNNKSNLIDINNNNNNSNNFDNNKNIENIKESCNIINHNNSYNIQNKTHNSLSILNYQNIKLKDKNIFNFTGVNAKDLYKSDNLKKNVISYNNLLFEEDKVNFHNIANNINIAFNIKTREDKLKEKENIFSIKKQSKSSDCILNLNIKNNTFNNKTTCIQEMINIKNKDNLKNKLNNSYLENKSNYLNLEIKNKNKSNKTMFSIKNILLEKYKKKLNKINNYSNKSISINENNLKIDILTNTTTKNKNVYTRKHGLSYFKKSKVLQIKLPNFNYSVKNIGNICNVSNNISLNSFSSNDSINNLKYKTNTINRKINNKKRYFHKYKIKYKSLK